MKNSKTKILAFHSFKELIKKWYPDLAGKMTSKQALQHFLDTEFPNKCEVILRNEKITKPINIIGVLDTDLPTTHWVVLFENIYIDSFGLVPPSDVWSQRKIDYINTHKFQRFDSALCGEYSLYLIYLLMYYDMQTVNKVILKM